MNINYTYVIGASCTASLGFVLMSYGFVLLNSLTKTLHGQYIHHQKYVMQDETLFNSIVSCLVPFGAIFGSVLVSPL